MALHARLTHEIRTGRSGPKVGAFFDLDQTLLAGFSATAFFRERLLSGRMGPRELAESFMGAVSFSLGRTEFSSFVSSATAGYRGLGESAMEDLGQELFEKHLGAAIYPESRALVKAHQEMGHTLAVVSSATRYQAGPLARDMQIPHLLCTRLEVEDGALTGRVLRPTCYGEGKVAAVRELASKHDVDLAQSYFYTDSHEDVRLLEVVGNPRPTNPTRRLAQVATQRGWPVRRFRSRGTPSAGDLLRSALVYGSLVPSVWAGLAAGLVNRSWREGINTAGSVWADLATPFAGVDLRVEGEEHLWLRRPAVFIFNHQSGIDVLLMLKLLRRDITGVGKQEVRWNPIFGPLFRAAGVVFIDRSHSARAIEALEPAVDALRQGLSLVIAPEGTRSPTPRLGRFKRGAFHIAMQAGVPIVPIVFRNALDALPKHAIVVRPATVEAVVLPPVDTREWRPESLGREIEAIRDRYREVLEG
jgi:putative phosphoserine phosphatase/1-acylglycerol-3-phosphate O-acyltransferase